MEIIFSQVFQRVKEHIKVVVFGVILNLLELDGSIFIVRSDGVDHKLNIVSVIEGYWDYWVYWIGLSNKLLYILYAIF